MKKLLTSAFLFLTILTASASNDEQKIRTEASDIARRLANQIELNESEYIQVKNYTLEKLAAISEIKEMYSNDREMMFRKLSETENDYNHKITSLLNSQQLNNYISVQNSLKADLNIIAATQE